MFVAFIANLSKNSDTKLIEAFDNFGHFSSGVVLCSDTVKSEVFCCGA